MEKQPGKSQDASARQTTEDSSHKHTKGALPFADNRPEAVAQRKLKETISNSPIVQKATQMQAMADEYAAQELPLIQHNEVTSNEQVAQRSPQDWQTNPDIARALNYGHGFNSTWKKVKQAITKYKELPPFPTASRTTVLNELSRLLNAWANKPLPASGRKLARANQITAVLPGLRALITTERAEIAEDQFVEAHYANPQAPVQIPAALTQGLNTPGQNVQVKAQQLFQNINAFPFRYRGRIPVKAAYNSHQGDCSTLAGMYVEVANAHGIPVNLQIENDPVLVTARAIHGRAAQSNTHGGTHWFFNEHYWVDVQGTQFDLLFMVSPPPPMIHKAADGQRRGVAYIIFANGLCVIKKSEFRKLSTNVNGQGMVFNNQNAAIAYIDQNIA